MKVKRVVRERAKAMRDELLERKLEVVIVPAPEQRFVGHCIRLVVNTPPDWFREHIKRCGWIPKRDATLRALAAIAKGQVRTWYAKHWLGDIERWLANELEQVPF